MLDLNNQDSLIEDISESRFQSMRAAKQIYEGMIPKLDNAFAAMKAGVNHIELCQADLLNTAIGTTLTL